MMKDGNNPERCSKSVQIRTKRRITSEDYCTSNNVGEESSNNWPTTSERAQRDTNTTTFTTSSPASERRSSNIIRTPLILEARTSKSNWYEPLKKSKVDLFQNFLQYSNNGSQSPHFYEEDSQPGVTSSGISRENDVKSMHGEKQNDSSKKTIALSQRNKRKLSNRNNLSAPTSKQLLCSAKKILSKRNQLKLDKPRTKSLLLNRLRTPSKTIVKKENCTRSKNSFKTNDLSGYISSKSKLYSTPKIPIPNVPIYQEGIYTCSNRQRSQSKRPSTAKSTRKSKKRRSSKSSIKRRRQSRASTAKRRKSKKTYAKPRKSNRTSNSRTQSKKRKSKKTKNKTAPRNSRIKRTGVKSKRNEARRERIENKRKSRANRLQSKKIEPLNVKLKETLKAKKTIKIEALTRKRRSVPRKDKRQSKNRKNTNTVRDSEVYSRKVSHANPPADVLKQVDKIDSLSEQGDSSSTLKERISITNNAEIQCCMLISSQYLPNTRAETGKNESINSNNFVNETSLPGEHLVAKQKSKISNLDQKPLGEAEQGLTSMNGDIGVASQSHSLTSNPNLPLLNTGATNSVMKEQAENIFNPFGQLEEHDEHLSQQNGKMSNLDGQSTTRKENLVCYQSHPLTLAHNPEMESRITDIMGERNKNPSNTFNDSRELNESLSNPPAENGTFDLKSFIQNETKENLLNMDNRIDRNNQSDSLTSAKVLQFDPGINGEQAKTRGHLNNYFGESIERFSKLLKKSDKNLDEQMNVRNTIKEHLMTIDEPVEAKQYSFQSFTNQNLRTNPGVAIDMVEKNENSSRLKKGRCNEFPKRELRNEISSDEPTDGNDKTELSLSNTDDQTETGSQSHSIKSFQSLSPTFSGDAKEMMSKEIKGFASSLNELKRPTEQRSDLPGDGSIYLNEQVDTNHKMEQCSTNVYDQAEDGQFHFKTSAQNSTLADVVAKVMKENIQPRRSLNENVEQLPKSTENISKDSNQQVNNELQETPHSESMALLPYEPPRFVPPILREEAASSFLSSESDGFNEQFSNAADETTTANEVRISLLELVSLSLSQGTRPEDITYSSDQIQEIESQIRSLRCIYIQESDSIPEDELGNETYTAEDDNVPVNYIRTSTSLLLQGLPNWLRYLYNNLFRSKK